MKTFLKSLCVGFVLAVIFTLIPFEGQCRQISDKVFRIHILANSDSKKDQELKLKVRDAVIARAEELFSDVHSKQEAETLVRENMDELLSVAQEVIFSEGFDYTVTGDIKKLRFDTRYYEDITMPGGLYDALQIRIGSAKGKNWWCVMYPSLCLYAASEADSLDEQLTPSQYNIVSSTGEFKLRFKAVEVFNQICDFFAR